MTARIAFAAAALAAVAAAAPASAAPVVAGNVYMDRTFAICSNSTNCEVVFTAVPAGKTLIVTDAGCVATTNNNVAVVSSVLRGRDSGGNLVNRNAYFTPVLTMASNGNRRYQMQMSTTMIMKAGDKPQVFLGPLSAPTAFFADCTIAGTLQ